MQGRQLGTRERIVEAAEALFAEHGFENVSLREITNAAGANVASVNYHFGSKEKLIEALVESYTTPLNERRLALLDELEEQHRGGPVPVEEILRAFLEPLQAQITRSELSDRLFCKFMGRLMNEQGGSCLPESVEPQFREMVARFAAAFRLAIPELSEELALWRIHYSFGVMANTLMHADTLQQISGGRAGVPGFERQLEQIIDFCKAGLQAPAST